jgi:DNA-binding NarL/FixJ family response regulator
MNLSAAASPDTSHSRGRRPSPLLAVESLSPRLLEIAAMRGLGYKLHEIADEFGCSPQSVSLMLARHRRRLSSLGPRAEHWQLSARATNVLGRLRISSREQARSRDILRLLRGQRNCGAKTIAEIERWLAENGGPSGSP